MTKERLTYFADTELAGTLFLPEAKEPHPAVLVFPDIFGLGEHALERAAELAGNGYAAFAADFHGEGRLLEVAPAMEALAGFVADPAIPCARGEAAFRLLQQHPAIDPARIAAIGYCYGGTLALELARRGLPLAAAVSFHGSLKTKMAVDEVRIAGSILACIGSEDPAIPAEERSEFEAEMRSLDVDWQLHLYGGVYHTFTDRRCGNLGNPDFARYSETGDRRSFKAMYGLLDEVF